MELINIKSAYGLCESLYGIFPDEDTFEDLALDALGRIGNKHTRLYRFIGNVHNGVLKLPCNVVEIESVHVPVPDAQVTSNQDSWYLTENVLTEGWIDRWKLFEDPYWTPGKLVKYKEGNGELYFSHDYPRVMVVYHGVLADEEDGLPLITEKESRAIAAFIAYISLYKESIQKRDGNLLKLAKTIETDWIKLCRAARVKDYLSQNDMDRILDACTSFNRKSYGKSFKFAQ